MKKKSNHNSFRNKKKFYILIAFIVFSTYSCSTYKPTPEGKEIFHLLNKVSFSEDSLTSNSSIHSTFENQLSQTEIAKLDSLIQQQKGIKIFDDVECLGCAYNFAKYKPVYKVKKGDFIHFGIETETEINNLVFYKNKSYVTQFTSYKGLSLEEFNGKYNKKVLDYLFSLSPTQLTNKDLFLFQTQYERRVQNSEDYYETVGTVGEAEATSSSVEESNNTTEYIPDIDWYESENPLKIEYKICFENIPELRFKFQGGLFSHQYYDDFGNYKVINFVETNAFWENAVDVDDPTSFSNYTIAYPGKGTFFLFEVEESCLVQIELRPILEGHDYKFSVFKNDQFKTLDEYLNTEQEQFYQYEGKLEKGEYLIRILDNTEYDQSERIFGIKINKILHN